MKKGEWKRVGKVLTKWTEFVFKTYKERLNEVRASGELQDTMSFGVKVNGNDYEAFLNLKEYWKRIEEGRLAGSFPPVDALIEWIEVKQIIPKPYTLPSGKQIIPTENQIAFLIGRKIKEDGIAPNPLLFETLEDSKTMLVMELRKALAEDIRDDLALSFGLQIKH